MRTLSKTVYLIAVASLTFWGCSEGKSKPASKKETPNLLIILADNMGYGDPLSYNPDSKISTPNIDRDVGRGNEVRQRPCRGPRVRTFALWAVDRSFSS